ncbi:MAG TPA: hypothetical protein VFY53_03745, partial [Rhodoplanes sp.]|nr:hypothetical protein [Rhodoplanes sp.]
MRMIVSLSSRPRLFVEEVRDGLKADRQIKFLLHSAVVQDRNARAKREPACRLARRAGDREQIAALAWFDPPLSGEAKSKRRTQLSSGDQAGSEA